MSLAAQDRGQQQYDAAYDAWDAGHYPEALQGFQKLLGTPDGERFVDPVALLTGELYRSMEVARSDQFVVNVTATNAPQVESGRPPLRVRGHRGWPAHVAHLPFGGSHASSCGDI